MTSGERIFSVAFSMLVGAIICFPFAVWWARNNVSDCGEIKQPEIDEGKIGIGGKL